MDSSSELLEGTKPANILNSDFLSPELWDSKFLLFKTLILW